METLLAIIFLFLLVFAATGAGRVACSLWSRKSDPAGERFIVDTALGLGVLSLVFFVISAAQLLKTPLLVVVFFVFTCIGIFSIINKHYGALSEFRAFVISCFRDKKLSGIVSAILLAIIAIAVLIPALAPPSMSDWDSLAYHLSVPKLFLNHGGMYYISFMSHSNFPMLMETIYTLPLQFDNPAAAKMVTYLTAVLLVASVMLLTRKHFSSKAAPLAAIAFAGMPIVMWLATTAYIDIAMALYTVLAVHLLLNYLDQPERHYIIGSAVAAGFAASTKMTGLVIIPLILAWLLIDRFCSQGRKIEWKNGLAFVVAALIVCSPWYIKSVIYTGSPVYPFFYSVFGGRNWTAELAHNYSTQQSLFGMGHGLAAFLMLPYNLAFHSEKFYDTAGLFVGPIFLVGLPVLLLAKYRSRKLVGLTLFFLAFLITWFALTQQSRYLVPGFAVLAVLIAALAYSDGRFHISYYALWSVFLLTAVFGILTLCSAITNTAPVVFCRESRDEYLSRTLDIYPADQWINENLPADAKIALFGDTRGFYLDRAYVWADPGHNAEFTRYFASPKKLVRYLKSRGVTHVLINYSFYPQWGKGTQAVYGAIDKGLLEQIYPNGDGLDNAVVYVIR
ncbi:glycosyltransferase family 39 protein [bacterium]|nr:glycosyltransferase family 39 protein [bacterium]